MHGARFLVRFILWVAVVWAATGCGSAPPVVETYPRDAARRVTIGGVEIHYFDFHQDGPELPLLWIHGYSGAAFETMYIREALGPNRRLIAPDLPGSGYSEKPMIDYTLDYYVDFLAGFVDALGLERYVLVGHSMGGLIAATFAADHPHGLERLVLLAPFGIDGAAGPIMEFLARTGVLVDYGFELHNETILELGMRFNVFYDPDRIPIDFVNYLSVSTFHTSNAIPALASITHNLIAADHDLSVLERLTIATLIIWGEDDRVLDYRFAAAYHRLVPGSTLRSIPGTGHLPHVESPGPTARIIREFLD